MSSSENSSVVHAFSDGSAIGNPGPGGYGVVMKWSDHYKELSGGFRRTTNNRMELMGVIMALESLKRSCKVIVTTDSEYVVNAMTKGWAQRWLADGWRRNKGKDPVLNPDLWARLMKAAQRHDVAFEWVRGHNGHPENERCDQLANAAARGANLLPDVEYEKVAAGAK
jgi:ribonuclease HI